MAQQVVSGIGERHIRPDRYNLAAADWIDRNPFGLRPLVSEAFDANT
jgi:hypothetical protein